MFIEKLVPGPLKNPYRRLRSAIKNRAFGSSNQQVFDEIYRQQAWGAAEEGGIYSGPGTYDPSVQAYVDYLIDFIDGHKVRSIVEIGCGDFSIGRQYAGKVASYLGVDASSMVIRQNQERFATDRISFVHADAAATEFPAADLCIIRQVLQHLDNRSIARILANAEVHRFVLVTEHLPNAEKLVAPNLNKRAGPDTRLIFNSGVYVEQPPFNRKGEVVLTLPVAVAQAHPGEVLRTTLLTNG